MGNLILPLEFTLQPINGWLTQTVEIITGRLAMGSLARRQIGLREINLS